MAVAIDTTDRSVYQGLVNLCARKTGLAPALRPPEIEPWIDEYWQVYPDVERATPVISVSAGGLITASATQEEGRVDAGINTVTRQLPTQGGKTVIPSSTEQVAVEAGVWTTGQVKVAAAGGGAPPSVEQATPVIVISGRTVTASAMQAYGVVAAGTKSSTAEIPSAARAKPVIHVNEMTGQIDASATQSAGYVSAGTENADPVQLETVEQATPQISIDASGLIRAVATQAFGIVTAGSKTGTLQLAMRAELDVDGFVVTALAGYYPSAVSVRVDSGTPGTATPATIFKGYIAWVNGERIVGTYEPQQGGTSGVVVADFTEIVYGLASLDPLTWNPMALIYGGTVELADVDHVVLLLGIEFITGDW